MNTIYPPVVNRIGIILAILGYGWFVGGLAGLLAMAFVVTFFILGVIEVAFGGWASSLWAVGKWFVLFLGYHFIIYLIHEPLAWEMLMFLGMTLERMKGWSSLYDIEAQLGFFTGILMVAAIIWMISMMINR